MSGGRLRFPIDGVRERWAHAKAAAEHGTPYSMEPSRGPGLWWVKDQGTYLMSNGLPGEPIGANCTYADGYGPEADWHEVRRVCGSDDFCEQIDAAAMESMLAAAEQIKAKWLVLDVEDETYELGVQQ